jgi:hypothetical protein
MKPIEQSVLAAISIKAVEAQAAKARAVRIQAEMDEMVAEARIACGVTEGDATLEIRTGTWMRPVRNKDGSQGWEEVTENPDNITRVGG